MGGEARGNRGRHLMALPAYDQCIKASHVFNLLDARGVISVTERQSYILRVRELAKACGEAWLATEGGGKYGPMSEMPEIGGRRPLPINVVAGKSYWWCACGRSKTQPFCDGSHKGTAFTPAGMEGGGEPRRCGSAPASDRRISRCATAVIRRCR